MELDVGVAGPLGGDDPWLDPVGESDPWGAACKDTDSACTCKDTDAGCTFEDTGAGCTFEDTDAGCARLPMALNIKERKSVFCCRTPFPE